MTRHIERQWRRRSWKKFRGFVWYEHLRTELDWSRGQIDAHGTEPGDRRSGACYGWEQRRHAPSPELVARFADVAPRSTALFFDGPWQLLDERTFPAGKVKELLDKFGRSPFFYPQGFTMIGATRKMLIEQDDFVSEAWSAQTQRLAVFNFFRELGRIRQVERHLGQTPKTLCDSQGQPVLEVDAASELHLLLSGQLFRGLPLLGQVPWLHKDFVYLCSLLGALRYSSDLTFSSLAVDWNALGQQFYNAKLRKFVAKSHAEAACSSKLGLGEPIQVTSDVPMELSWPWPANDMHRP